MRGGGENSCNPASHGHIVLNGRTLYMRPKDK